MKFLIVSDAYPPEIRSAAHLMQELAEELRDRKHGVTVATCYPKYNLAEEMPKTFPPLAIENGIRVLRIKSLPHHKVSFIVRGLSQLILPGLFNAGIRRRLKGESFDAVIVYSPPLPLWRVGSRIKADHGARFILNVQDLFPQNAVDLNALRNPLLIRYFRRMERRAYRAADVVTVHSEGNRDFLLGRKAMSPDKLAVLHNWVDMDAGPAENGSGRFRKAWGLKDKFVFFFGGVIGPAQGLDLIIEAARELRHERNIAILLVGDGTERRKLERLASGYGLDNVVFKPFISKADYRELLAEVDVGLVCLRPENRTPVVPGKILGYMAEGLPVAALLNRESDGHAVIRDSGCGFSDLSGDARKAARLMQTMYELRSGMKALGELGRRFAAVHYAKQACVDSLEALCFPDEPRRLNDKMPSSLL